MSVIVTQDEFNACRQHVRNEYARITVYNKQSLVIGQLEGKVIDGSINIDNSSFLRKQAQLKLILDSTTLPNQVNSLIVTQNQYKLEIGILNNVSGNIVWFNQGFYLIKDTQATYDVKTKELQINLLDKMAVFSGDIGGQFISDILITYKGTPISDAIKAIVQMGGETNYRIDPIVDSSGNVLIVPMTISAKAGSTMLDVLKSLISLYMYWDFYYDINGTFVCTHTATLLSDAVTEDFTNNTDLTIQYQDTNSYTYIKNHVKVLGNTVQPMIAVQDMASTTNPNPINGTSSLRVTFNKPLYDSNGNMIADQQDVTKFFTYNGTASNYIKGIYSASTWQITFTINGENGKTIAPLSNTIYDDTQMPLVPANCTFVYSSKDTAWSPLLCGTIILDGVNNKIQFKLDFNKPLYNQSGTAIATNTNMMSAFTYSDGTGTNTNFLSAVYTINSSDYYILLTFVQPTPYMVVQINTNGIQNSNSIYDSAGTIYQISSYIMDGNEWTVNVDPNNPTSQITYQISYELKNTDPTSPYNINSIGDRLLVVNDNTIFNLQQSQLRAQYELQQRSNLNEKLSLTCLGLYYLDVNTLIFLENTDLNISAKYRIDKLTYNLKNGTMGIDCSKVYM